MNGVCECRPIRAKTPIYQTEGSQISGGNFCSWPHCRPPYQEHCLHRHGQLIHNCSPLADNDREYWQRTTDTDDDTDESAKCLPLVNRKLRSLHSIRKAFCKQGNTVHAWGRKQLNNQNDTMLPTQWAHSVGSMVFNSSSIFWPLKKCHNIRSVLPYLVPFTIEWRTSLFSD